MNTKIYRGPWEWNAAESFWTSPAGFVGLDLRPLQQQATAGGTPGLGVFVGLGTLGKDYDLLGTGAIRDIKSNQRMKDALPGKFRPRGDDLLGLILDILTEGADPDGIDGPKPLMPSAANRIELYLAGQSHYESFRWGDRYTSKVRDVIRRDFAQTMADAQSGRLKDREHHRRVLDAYCEKFGIEDWKEFVPVALQRDIPGRLKHETSYSDDFNRSNSDSLGGNWTEVVGDMDIASNRIANGDTTDNIAARWNSDLSSADHYAQIDYVAEGNGVGTPDNSFVGPAVRFDSSATTYYRGFVRRIASTSRAVQKLVAGTATNIASNNTPASVPQTVKLEVNGSSLTLSQGGSAVVGPTTDTAITGNLKPGVCCRGGTGQGTGQAGDNWSAADLAASGILFTQLEGFPRGVTRGMYTRWGG